MAHAVPACIWGFRGFENCLSLKDLCSLSLARRDWQDPVVALYSSACARKLVHALAACNPELNPAMTAGPNKRLHQLWRVVSILQQKQPWGPALAATPGLLHDCTQLFTVSGLPSHIIRLFVQHVGVHISCQQLITAAYNRVAGVEVWVHHQQHLGIQTDIPDTIAKLCYGYLPREDLQWLETWRPTNSKDFVDMMHVMLNCSPCTSDWYNLDSVVPVLITQIENTATILHLLSTAVARGHHKVVEAALKMPVVQQFDAAAVMQLMLADVAAEGVGAIVRCSRGDMMHLLVQLPAATYVDATDMMLLLDKSVAIGNGAAVKALCTLSATETTPAETIVRLLGMAIKLRLDEAVAALCSLPAAESISNHEWIILATAAIQGKLKCGSARLCQLPAAADAAHEPVAELLSSAVHSKLYPAAEALVSLPAAGCMPSEQVFELTKELVTHLFTSSGDHYQRLRLQEQFNDTLKGFGKLKAVQDMSSTELLKLFNIAAQRGEYYALFGGLNPSVTWLAGLPAASSIPAEVLHQQMQEAVQKEDVRLLSYLCELPGARQTDADALLQLLNMARKEPSEDSNTSRTIQKLLLCRIGVQMQLSHSQLVALMLAAVSISYCISNFNHKSPSKLLTTGNVIDLLAAAVQVSNHYNVDSLCRLPAATSISGTVVAELISAVVKCRECGKRASTLTSLCSLPGAREIPKDIAAALIRKAEKKCSWRSVQALLPLQKGHSQRLKH